MIEKNKLNLFLYFGYIPNSDIKFLNHIVHSKLKNNKFTEYEDINKTIKIGKQIFSSIFENRTSNKIDNIVPLSGGLDSRAILSGLLECLQSNNITTVTFGTPNTWDFSIGNLVAKKIGTKHHKIDLTKDINSWSTESLVETARNLDSPIWIFDKHINKKIVDIFGINSTYWSGFMGDPIAGSHLHEIASTKWEDAVDIFLKKNRRTHFKLNKNNYKNDIPNHAFYNKSVLEYEEQLDFSLRQGGYIQQIVLQKEFNFSTPFLHEKWIGFMLNSPRTYRYKQYLYKNILFSNYHHLFKLPTKNLRGKSLSNSKQSLIVNNFSLYANSLFYKLFGKNYIKFKNINYVDFEFMMIHNNKFNNLIKENLHDLSKRNIIDWINFKTILNQYTKPIYNLTEIVTTLVSLEIYLKSKNIQ